MTPAERARRCLVVCFVPAAGIMFGTALHDHATVGELAFGAGVYLAAAAGLLAVAPGLARWGDERRAKRAGRRTTAVPQERVATR